MSNPERKSHVETLREFIRSEKHAMHTITFVRVETVHHDRQQADVSFKSDPNIIIEDVPIASSWARDGVGIIVPIDDGDEGLILHPREPMADQIQERGPQGPADSSERRFQMEDAVLLPMLWLETDSLPERSDNELVMKHDSGSYLRLDEKGVHIGPELYVEGTPYTTHGHPYSWTDSGGSSVTDEPVDESKGGAPEVS